MRSCLCAVGCKVLVENKRLTWFRRTHPAVVGQNVVNVYNNKEVTTTNLGLLK